MKIKVIDTVKDYEGKEIKDAEGKALAWRVVIFNALNNIAPDEKMSTEEKEKCYRITKLAYGSDEIDLGLDERAFIIGRIGKVYSPLIYGQAKEYFEEKS